MIVARHTALIMVKEQCDGSLDKVSKSSHVVADRLRAGLSVQTPITRTDDAYVHCIYYCYLSFFSYL